MKREDFLDDRGFLEALKSYCPVCKAEAELEFEKYNDLKCKNGHEFDFDEALDMIGDKI